MKNIFSIIFFCIATTAFAQKDIHTGMSDSEILIIFPDLEKTSYENTTTYTRPDTIYGLDSEWGYKFENNSLNWIYFMRYEENLNEENFKAYLEATQRLIKDYAKIYGIPDSLIQGDMEYKDPYVEHHWGYDVLEARWYDADGMKIKIRFIFMGGKGEYHFLLTIDMFDKSYSYF